MITAHVWRPMAGAKKDGGGPCQFMNCRRPKSDHRRAVSSISRWGR